MRPDGTIVDGVELASPSLDNATLERLTEALVVEARPPRSQTGDHRTSAGLPVQDPDLCSREPAHVDPRAPPSDRVGHRPRHPHHLGHRTGAAPNDLPLACAALGAFRATGITVSLDDVSTGGSSLSVLRAVPLDEVRVDAHAIDPVESQSADRAIVRAVVGLAHDLGLHVSATGVQTSDQADVLDLLGCTHQQGSRYFGPLTVHEFVELIAETSATGRVIR